MNTVRSASIKGIAHVIINHLGDAIDDTINVVATVVVAASAIIVTIETTSVTSVVTST